MNIYSESGFVLDTVEVTDVVQKRKLSTQAVLISGICKVWGFQEGSDYLGEMEENLRCWKGQKTGDMSRLEWLWKTGCTIDRASARWDAVPISGNI